MNLDEADSTLQEICDIQEDHEITSEDNDVLQIVDRAYQIEMFEKSMQCNIIVCMGTGTGKTQIAKLRIEAELRRSPGKRIWFTAPKVFLVEQQYLRLSKQLPLYNMKLLTGDDNVDFWRSQHIWDAALSDVNAVFSTPQILLDALGHGFIRMTSIALLVVDEAHHTQANNPSRLIMRDYYHTLSPCDRPHILGLTASIRISEKTASTQELESTLDAVCQSPVRSIDDYVHRLNEPCLMELTYDRQLVSPPLLLQDLTNIVDSLTVEDDPTYVMLRQAVDIRSRQKVEKMSRNGNTPLKEQLKSLQGHAQHLFDNLGPWAANHFVLTCAQNWHTHISALDTVWQFVKHNTAQVIDLKLDTVRGYMNKHPTQPSLNMISGKATRLIQYLAAIYHPDVAVIIFVERRSTAFTLCELLRNAPGLVGYGVFPFVGMSRATCLADVSDANEQREAFAHFRAGLRNLCVATSTVEEGIDVPAVDVVIRFDDPHQFVSYVQSRGRARQQNSKFAYLRARGDDHKRYRQWAEFEKELKVDYEEGRKQLLELQEVESSTLQQGEVYKVEGTGATLSFENALSVLGHFCGVTCKGQSPIYVIDAGEGQSGRRARVILPASVPSLYQTVESRYLWPSERMAKRDAAFQAVRALHGANLISDNLVPFRRDPVLQNKIKEKTVLHEATAQFDVWNTQDDELWEHQLQVSSNGSDWQPMVMTMPVRLAHSLVFDIAESPERKYDVRLELKGSRPATYLAADSLITKSLFRHAFASGSAWSSLSDNSSIPLSIVPAIPQTTDEELPLMIFMSKFSQVLSAQPIFVWDMKRVRPYLWHPSKDQDLSQADSTITVTKINRLQVFSSLPNNPGMLMHTSTRELRVADCIARPLGSICGPAVMLVPTILEIVQATLRAQRAQCSVLSPIGFSSAQELLPALLAKSAFGNLNYERLEFIGDAILKFRVALQLFVEHPLQLEDGLTEKLMQMVSNNRLCKIVLKLAIIDYVTTNRTVQKHWMVPKRRHILQSQPANRQLGTKTIADVAESVLGAAYMNGQARGESEDMCSKVLALYYPDYRWLPCADLVQNLEYCGMSGIDQNAILVKHAERLLGYRFSRPELLLQAITHSTSVPGALSYDRLEFLGDALLDIIIKERLFKKESLDPSIMTLHRHALASHTYLAYCALSLEIEQVDYKPITSDNGQTVTIEACATSKGLLDFIVCSDRKTQNHVADARSKYASLKTSCEAALASSRFPWTLLSSLNAPKICSDVIESLLAAIYLDSSAAIEPCAAFLERLGMFDLLERMIEEAQYESETPLTQLQELCAKRALLLRIDKPRRLNETIWTAEILIGKKEVGDTAHYKENVGGCAEEARLVLAEKVVKDILAGEISQQPAISSNSSSTALTVVASDDESDDCAMVL